jgi:hypothetical protein
MRVHAQTYDLDKVEVLDTKANKLDRNAVIKRLQKETVALATWSAPLDPLHLRVVNDGTLIFVLPNPGFPGAIPPGAPGFPGAQPGLPGAPGGVAPALQPQPVPVGRSEP